MTLPRWRRITAGFLLPLLVGCQTWHPTTLSPQAVLSEETPSSMRVTRSDGEVVTIKNPAMRNDSIVSLEEGLVEVVGVHTIDVNSLEVRRFNASRTLLFVAGAAVVALGWANAVTGSSGGTDPGDPPLPKGPGG